MASVPVAWTRRFSSCPNLNLSNCFREKFVSAASDTLVPILGALTDVLPRAGHMGKGLFLQLSESNVPDSPEGYVLEVNDKGVTVTARTEAGLFYGCQTLEQLFEDN